MRKKKQKSNPIVKVVANMVLARNLNCSYEEAAKISNKMNKTIL